MKMHRQRRAISTVSLGWHDSHTLERKITAAAKHGFEGIELFWTDLTNFAKSHSMTPLEAAPQIRKLCAQANLAIVCLASFNNFEGSQIPLVKRLAIAHEWMTIAHALGTDLIQIPSTDADDAIGNDGIIVAELQALADFANSISPPIRFAYEALAWGTHVADWEESLRIVELVNRPNFGLCMDTFHIVSRLWADPRSVSGVRPGGYASLIASIQRFLSDCPRDKVFYVQLSDAERLSPPLLPGHPAFSENRDPLLSWCSWGRLFPYEKGDGAYFEMFDILKALLMSKGWNGWVSMEIFHREMEHEVAGPEHWAKRGEESLDYVTDLLIEKGHRPSIVEIQQDDMRRATRLTS